MSPNRSYKCPFSAGGQGGENCHFAELALDHARTIKTSFIERLQRIGLGAFKGLAPEGLLLRFVDVQKLIGDAIAASSLLQSAQPPFTCRTAILTQPNGHSTPFAWLISFATTVAQFTSSIRICAGKA